MKRYLLIFLSLGIFFPMIGIATTTTATSSATQNTNPTDVYLSPTQPPASNTCEWKCRTFNDGYIGKIKNINVATGDTTCYVYHVNTSGGLDLPAFTTDTNHNAACENEYEQPQQLVNKYASDVPAATTAASYGKGNHDGNLQDFSNEIKQLKTQYFTDYASTGSVQFLTASKYLVAALTADPDRIDIPATVAQNKIVVGDNYTLYPNGNPAQNETFWQNIKSSVVHWYDKIMSKPEPEPVDLHLYSQIEDVISTAPVLFIDFLANSSQTVDSINTTMLIAVLAFGAFYIPGTLLTKKISGIQNQNENYAAMIVGALFLLLFMYKDFNTVKITSDDQPTAISETLFQKYAREAIITGVSWADDLAKSFSIAYAGYVTRDAGLPQISEAKSQVQRLAHLKYETSVLKPQIDECFTELYTDNIAAYLQNQGMIFPSSETMDSYTGTHYSRFIAGKSGQGANWYNQTFYKNAADVTATDKPAVTGCYNFQRRYNRDQLEIKDITAQLQNVVTQIQNRDTKDMVHAIIETQFKNTATLGFLGAPFIALSKIAVDNSGGNLQAQKESAADKVEDSETRQNPVSARLQSWIVDNLAIQMMPGYDSVHSAIKNMMITSSNSASGFLPLGKVLSKLPLPSEGIFSSLKNLGKIDPKNPPLAFKAAVTAVSIYVYKQGEKNAPIIVIIIASLMVIMYYFISIMLYFIAIPFFVIYAVSTQQGELFKTIFKRALVFMIQPSLLVLSIAVAIVINDLFEVFGVLFVHMNFDALFSLSVPSVTGVFDNFILRGIEGFLTAIVELIKPALLFFIIMFGHKMLLNMLGVQDHGHDSGEMLGGQVGRKAERFLPV